MSQDNEPQHGAKTFKMFCQSIKCMASKTFDVLECFGDESDLWCRVSAKCAKCGSEVKSKPTKRALSCFDDVNRRCKYCKKKAEEKPKKNFLSRLLGR